MEIEKPRKLYRGVTLNYNKILRYNFDGDLVPPPSNLYDELGRKVVGDGNEYGVYMSDNYSMVYGSYGKDKKFGEIISHISVDNNAIKLPSVSIIYEIDTDGLQIRTPFIRDGLKGVKNNGYVGNEWIADSVPFENYEYNRILVGSDMLHDEEVLNLRSGDNIRFNLITKLKERKQHLDTMIVELERLSKDELNRIKGPEIEILKRCFGKNGIAYYDVENVKIKIVSQMIDYLQFKTFKKSDGKIDFETLKYLENMRKKCTDIDDIQAIIYQDREKNQTSKEDFEKRKKIEKSPYSTRSFDIKDAKYAKLMTLFISAKSYMQQPINNSISGDDDWELFKEKYEYDEMSPQEQLNAEEKFRKMIDGRKSIPTDRVDEVENPERRGRR